MRVTRGHTGTFIHKAICVIASLILGVPITYAQCDTQYDALMAIYNATNGDNWSRNDDWGSNCDICEWYGISCDAYGNVISLNFYNNGLSGVLPDVFSSLPHLESFDTYNCDLNGTIPLSLTDIETLYWINLGRNNFSGSIPEGLFNLPLLQVLYLNDNQLEGMIPDNISASLLVYLYVQNNLLSGEIPPSIGELTSLERFSFYRNDFTGSLPEEIGQCVALKDLKGYNNFIDGPIPSSLASLSNLEEINLSNNYITGGLGLDWSGLTSLKTINLNGNQIDDVFPHGIVQTTNLEEIRWNNNFISGSLPANLGSLNNIQILHLYNNLISGSIPNSIGSLTGCRELDLSRNLLTGSIPETIGGLSSLLKLKLNENELTGTITDGICSLSQIQELKLELNNLSGGIPPCIGNLTSLTRLRMNSNELSGSLPESMGLLSNLSQISFYENRLTGCYPESYSIFCGINTLAFNDNCLSIPFEDFCSGFQCNSDSTVYISSSEGNQVCSGTPTDLNALSTIDGWMYEWSTGQSGVNMDQITVLPASNEQYSVTVTTIEGCEFTDDILIAISDLEVNIDSPLEYCFLSGGIQLEASPPGGMWAGDYISSSGVLSPVELVTEYNISYEFIDNIGCADRVETIIIVNPIIESVAEASICEGELYEVGGEIFSESGEYTVDLMTIAGCDSVVYLDLVVNPIEETHLSEWICEGELYEVGGEIFSESGEYTVDLMTIAGCDSVVYLDLVVNSIEETYLSESICEGELYEVGGEIFSESGEYTVDLMTVAGCDSVVYLDLVVNSIEETYLSESICEGELYEVGGEIFSESGEYTVDLMTIAGCDSVVYLDLVVNSIEETYLSESICEGELYEVGGEIFSESGEYTVDMMTIAGCDSVVYLDLVVNSIEETYLSESICEGELYEVGGEIFSESGEYTVDMMTIAGCDSVVYLDLVVNSIEETYLSESICEGELYEVGGEIFSESGDYTIDLMTVAGCDSMVYLDLVVNSIEETYLSESICEGELYEVGGEIFSESGEYTVDMMTIAGCDSVVYLDLVVNSIEETYLSESICEGEVYEVGGEIFSESGDYTIDLMTVAGCDSMVYLDLVVNSIEETYLSESICEGELYEVGGEIFSESGEYTVDLMTIAGCDSVVYLDLVVNSIEETYLSESICEEEVYEVGGEIFSESGDYTIDLMTVAGCDSVVYLDLNVLVPTETILDASICEGENYEIGQFNFSEPGEYVVNLTSVGGCDSTIVLLLEVYEPVVTNLEETVCSGEIFTVEGEIVTESGLYQYVLDSHTGCDSIINIEITIYPDYEIWTQYEICSGDVLILGEEQFSEPGSYDVTLLTSVGCDSVIIFDLFLNDIYHEVISEEICQGDSLFVGYDTLMNEGFYDINLISSKGCDSIISIDLSVIDPEDQFLEISICRNDSFEYNGNYFSEEGIYTIPLEDGGICNNQMIIDLTFYEMDQTTIDTSMCHGGIITYLSEEITSTGTYTYTLSNRHGCDSLITLLVEELPLEEYYTSVAICPGDTVSFGNLELHSEGEYEYLFTSTNGCDSLVILNITVLDEEDIYSNREICPGDIYDFYGIELFEPGSYETVIENESGCISTVYLELDWISTSKQSIDTVFCSGNSITIGDSMWSQPGTYYLTELGIHGCMDTIEVQLEEMIPDTNLVEVQICEGKTFIYHGVTYSEEGIYFQEVENEEACHSISEISINVNPSDTSIQNVSICAGEIFVYRGDTLGSTGEYEYTFSSMSGCDSVVTLHLEVGELVHRDTTINLCAGEIFIYRGDTLGTTRNYEYTFSSMSGCDSVVTLHLEVEEVLHRDTTISLCAGEIFVYRGDTLGSTGAYEYTFSSMSGCDSVVTLHLEVEEVLHRDTTISICAGEIFVYRGDTLGSTGAYEYTFSSMSGCDSVVTLHLDVGEVFHRDTTISICEGEIFVYRGDTLGTTGEYEYTFSSMVGCDSVVTLHLEVEEVIHRDTTISICAGEIFVYRGDTLGTTGKYEYTFSSMSGCDSVVTLHLEVEEVLHRDTTISICAGEIFVYRGDTLGSAGNYEYTFSSMSGCDSVVTLQLEVEEVVHRDTTISLCAGEIFIYRGDTLGSTGEYEYTFSSMVGCDSVVTLHLEVEEVIPRDTTISLCAGEIFIYRGDTLGTTGEYEYTFSSMVGCDSVVTLHLEVEEVIPRDTTISLCAGEIFVYRGDTLGTTGEYEYTFSSMVGCDSVVTLHLEVEEVIPRDTTISLCAGEIFIYRGDTLGTTGEYEYTFSSMVGCDSVVTLHLEVEEVIPRDTTISICAGEIFVYRGDTLGTTGEYEYTFSSMVGCDSVVTLHLEVEEVIPRDTTISICAGEIFIYRGDTLGTTGEYEYTFSSMVGCDSVVTLHLEVEEVVHRDTTISLCAGEIFVYRGDTLGTTGEYEYTFSSMSGCDSMVTLHLEVEEIIHEDLTVIICEGEELIFQGDTINKAGNYEFITTTESGCERTINLSVNVHPTETIYSTINLCEGEVYTVHGIEYNSPTIVKNVTQDPEGCTVIEFIELKFLNHGFNDMNVQICEGEIFELLGNQFTETGLYKVITENEAGCDSIINVSLNVVADNTTILDEEICEGDSVNYNGNVYFETGDYYHYYTNLKGCDSIIILQLLVLDEESENLEISICDGEVYSLAGNEYAESGEYQVLIENDYCFKTINLNLNVDPFNELFVEGKACPGETYHWRDFSFSNTGSFQRLLNSETGCDTVVYFEIESYEVQDISIKGEAEACDNNEVALSVETTGNVLWNTGDTIQSIVIQEGGNYSVTVTDEKGCISSTQHHLELIPLPKVDEINIAHANDCYLNSGSIELIVEDSILVSLDEGASWQQDYIIKDLPPGEYGLTIAKTDTACMLPEPIELVIEEKPAIIVDSVLYRNSDSCTEATGQIHINANSEIGSLEYSINERLSWQESRIFNQLSTGSYIPHVRIVDTDCEIKLEAPIFISEPTNIQVESEILNIPVCPGDANGAVQILIEDQDLVQSLEWPDGEEVVLRDNLESGPYNVKITSIDGCESWITIEIPEAQDVAYSSVLPSDTSICKGTELLLNNIGESLQIMWYDDSGYIGSGDSLVIENESMIYLEVSDDRSCFVVDSLYVNVIEEDHSGIDFLLSEEGLVGSPMVIVDVSWPEITGVTWEFQDSEVVILEIMDNQVIIEFPDTGVYEVTMNVDIGECPFSITKETRIVGDESELGQPGNFEGLGSFIQDFRLFPNPNFGIFSTRIGLKQPGSVLVTIVSSMGRMVHQQALHNENLYTTMMDISDEPPGIYTIIVQSELEVSYLSFSKN